MYDSYVRIVTRGDKFEKELQPQRIRRRGAQQRVSEAIKDFELFTLHDSARW